MRELTNIIKHINILSIAISEGKERKGEENLFEGITAEDFPNLGGKKKATQIQIQEANTQSIQQN